MTVLLTQLEKAHTALSRSLAVFDKVSLGKDIDLFQTTRSGVIQNFEVAYEQSWKVLRRWMLEYLSISDSELAQRRQLYRVAAKHGLIDNVEAWWDFHAARNMTSHTYSEAIAVEVAAAARSFAPACAQLIASLQAKPQDE